MNNTQADHRYNILIESRLTKLETLIENHDSRMNKLDSGLSKLEEKFDKHFYWTIGLILVSILLPYVNAILKAKGVLP